MRATPAPIGKIVAGFFTLVSIFSTPAVHAQSERVELPRTQLRVEEIIRSVQRQTDYVFAFNRRTFDVSRTIRVASTEASVEELLERITDGTDHSWLLQESYIVIHKADPLPEPQPKPAPEPDPRTNDVYSPSDPGVADAFRSRESRPETPAAPSPAPPAPVRAWTPPAELPAPFSNYLAPDIYAPIRSSLPRVAVKTDLLYGALTLTPNFGIEWGLTARSSIEFTGGWNQINHEERNDDNRRLNHGIARLEYRRWLCERYNGHFLGAHLFAVKYNVGGYEIPTLFKRELRYEGYAVGAGLTYGYHLPLARRWGAEFVVGMGVARFDQKRFVCVRCGNLLDRSSGVWFGPTRAAVNLVFML